jgi:DNA-binding transcriptional MerR regulator
MENQVEYRVRDLALAAGVTVRTVHYYIAEGLLPPPLGEGRRARYTTGHLARLKLIAALRDEGLSLAAIRARVAVLNDAEAQAALDTLEQRGDDDSPAVTAVGLFEAAVTEQLASHERPFMAKEALPAYDDQSAGAYVARLLQRSSPPEAQPAPRAPSTPAGEPVRPEAWFTYRIADGIELRLREDRQRRATGRMQGVVDGLRELLRRYQLTRPDDPPDHRA